VARGAAPWGLENFTDPDSRIMNTDAGYEPCYNAQAAVDEGSRLIVASGARLI
jgi:hypothetical protein